MTQLGVGAGVDLSSPIGEWFTCLRCSNYGTPSSSAMQSHLLTCNPVQWATVDMIVTALRQWSQEDRLAVFAEFCRFCGDDDPQCQCWNDE